MEQVRFKATIGQIAAVDAKANEAGITRSQYLRSCLPEDPNAKELEKKHQETSIDNSIRIYLSTEEKEALQQVAKISVSMHVRKLIRQDLNMPRIASDIEIKALNKASHELMIVGRTLTQIITMMEISEGMTPMGLTDGIIEKTSKRIDRLVVQIREFIKRAKWGDVSD